LIKDRELTQLDKRLKASEKTKVDENIFAQLYLLIDKIETGGIIFDREGNFIQEAVNMHQRREATKKSEIGRIDAECKMNNEIDIKTPPAGDTKALNLPKRNLYITYKAFPSSEKLATPIAWQQSEPTYNHGA
jgi:hypothetical protein